MTSSAGPQVPAMHTAAVHSAGLLGAGCEEGWRTAVGGVPVCRSSIAHACGTPRLSVGQSLRPFLSDGRGTLGAAPNQMGRHNPGHRGRLV